MAFPAVGNFATSTSNAASHVISLPDGIATGQRVIVAFFCAEDRTVTFPAGWTKYFDAANNGGTGRLALGYRDVDGTEGFDGTGDTITVTTSGGGIRACHHSWRITAYGTATAPTASTAVDGSSDLPDPASLTPGGGAKDFLWITVAGWKGNVAVTTYPTNYTNGTLTQTGSGGGQTDLGSARRNLNASSENTGAFDLDGTASWVAVTTAIAPVGNVTVAVGQATETDTANAIAPIKARSAGQAESTEAAQTFTPSHTTQVGIAASTEEAQAIALSKHVAAGQATETDTADALTPGRGFAVGQAESTEEAQGLVALHSLAVAQAESTEEALGFVSARLAPVDQAEETDTANAVSYAVGATVAQAEETDEVFAVTPDHQVLIDQVEESDVAQMISPVGFLLVEIERAEEFDSSQAVEPALVVDVGRAEETDEAQTIFVLVVVAIGQAEESDTADGITTIHLAVVGQVTESDEGFVLDFVAVVPVDTRRWRFRTPVRTTTPTGDHPLWRRVHNRQGVALAQLGDGVWREFIALPDWVAPNADYRFGRGDRSSIPVGKGFAPPEGATPEDMGFRSCLRLYLGGRVYLINEALQAELDAAVTDQEPDGYGPYTVQIDDDDSLEGVGDEVMVSGRTTSFEMTTSQT